MKVRITHLKAPWPSGALVGSVTEFEGDEIPAWALGKCVQVEDSEEVTAPAAGEEEAQSATAGKKKG